MRINRQTMLFEDINADEFAAMSRWASDVILTGEVPWPDPEWLQDWMKELGYKEGQRLLLITTTIPQRVLLSLLHANQANTQHCVGNPTFALETNIQVLKKRLENKDLRESVEILEDMQTSIDRIKAAIAS